MPMRRGIAIRYSVDHQYYMVAMIVCAARGRFYPCTRTNTRQKYLSDSVFMQVTIQVRSDERSQPLLGKQIIAWLWSQFRHKFN